jgi:ABC-type multidrug transport system fused ATPase/permease subunit
LLTAYVGFGNSLTAPRVITALALLTQLRFPLVFLPFILIQTLNLRISLTRVNRFLKNKEIRQKPEGGAAREEEGEFAPIAEGGVAEAVTDADGAKSGRSAVSLQGSFAWMPLELPPPRKGKGGGKGTGSSKGGRGKGAQVTAPAEDPCTRSTRSVRGRGSGKAGRFVPRMTRAGTASVPLDVGIRASPLDSVPAEPPVPAERKMKPSLVDIKLEIPAGSLTMIAGSVGSGKSSVLAALLGEMVAQDSADFTINGSVAYAAQTPFIASDTVRANILFGSEMDEDWYHRVVDACALTSDLEMLAGGDMTQIGEKGINVSGGQKARIALARAVYARADVYLLDDPLSAVDAHVGKHLFQQVIGPEGLLADKTRVLVTHQTQYLPLADDVVLIEAGSVMMRGHFDELRKAENADDIPALTGLLEDVSVAEDVRGSVVDPPPPGDDAAPESKPPSAPSSEPPSAPASGPPSKHPSHREDEEDDPKAGKGGVIARGDAKQNELGAQLVHLEERQTGAIDSKVFKAYIRAAGGNKLVVLAIILCCIDRGLTTFTDLWLAYWIEGRFADSENFGFWIPIYVGLAFAASFAVYGRSVFTMVCLGVTASKHLHAQLLDSVLRGPTSFFETTPSGRILNRFTSDTEMCDNTLLQNLQQWVNCVLPIISTLVIISVINPIFIPWLLFLGVFYVALYRHSVAATRDMQRLNQVSRSPIFSQFSETLSGLTTIRSFGAGPRFEATSERLVNANTRCAYSQYVLSQWVTLFLDLMAASIVFCAALFPIIALESGWVVSISLVGLSLNYSFELSNFLKHATRMTLEVQKSFAGIERIVEYIVHVPSERLGGDEPPAGHWPSAGAIEMKNLAVRYRPELPLALRAVTCTIPPKAKVGIVGRTGSGKSTFLSSIWRLIEAEGGMDGTGAGAIRIDGVDISTLKLPSLRSRLAIIPQDPVLFNDSVRYNLDPFATATDAELHEVLALVQLSDAIAALPGTLDHKVSEGGANFSVGQRQLLCLARATLRRSMLLALDEATASIDNETDAVLQTAIRRMFADCTVLTIAHRLHTIMDSTSIMLFESGLLCEYDEPHTLLADPTTKFSRLVAKTGAAAAQLREMARAAHEGRSREAGDEPQ